MRINENLLYGAISNSENAKIESVAAHTISHADASLLSGPYSVADKPDPPPGGMKNDYWHPAPYHWPSPIFPSLLPTFPRDGVRVPGTRMAEPGSECYDRTRLQYLFDDMTSLALAAVWTLDNRYVNKLYEIISVWYIDSKTRMNPHMNFSQTKKLFLKTVGSPSGIIETKDNYYTLDAISMLKNRIDFDENIYKEIQGWYREFLDWLINSKLGRLERKSSNNHGTYYDLQIASIAKFLCYDDLIRETISRSDERLVEQFDSEGFQIEEAKRTNTAHYFCFNIQGWLHLSRYAELVDLDLWSITRENKSLLKSGVEWIAVNSRDNWPLKQRNVFDWNRVWPIYFDYLSRYGKGDQSYRVQVPNMLTLPVKFHAHDGIRPYWQLDARYWGLERQSLGLGEKSSD